MCAITTGDIAERGTKTAACSVVKSRGAGFMELKRRRPLTDILIEEMNPKNFAKAGLVAALVVAANASVAGPDNMVVAVQQLPVIVEPQGINNNALDRVAYSIYETLIRADLFGRELEARFARER